MLTLNYSINISTKPCVVFIHGFLGSMLQWTDISAAFSNDYSTLKIELPGHGNSTDFAHSYSIDDLAESILRIFEKENLQQIHLVGHSMGGYVAAKVLTKSPKPIQSLTMINSIAGADSPERQDNRNRSINLIDRFKEAFISMAVGNLFSKTEHEAYAARIDAMKSQAQSISTNAVKKAIIAMRDRAGSLETLMDTKSKINYIYSNSDDIILEEVVQNEIERLDARGFKIKSGHMSILTHPDKIINILKSILVDR